MESGSKVFPRVFCENRVPEPCDASRGYLPTDIVRGEGSAIQRNIFGLSFTDSNLAFSEFELDQVAALDHSWGEAGDPFIGTGIEETQKLRFIQGCGWDLAAARDALCRYTEWRKALSPAIEQPPDRNSTDTWLYFFGHDKCYRPVIIIDCRRLLDLRSASKEALQVEEVVISAMTYFASRLAVPGHVEQVVAIVDFDGCSTWDTPLEEVQKIVQVLTSTFRARLNRLLVINTPLIFYTFWKLVKVFLPERTAAKVSIFRHEYMSELNRVCDEDQIDPALKQDPGRSS